MQPKTPNFPVPTSSLDGEGMSAKCSRSPTIKPEVLRHLEQNSMVSNNWKVTCFVQQRLPVSSSPVVEIGEEEVSETMIAR